MKEQIVQSSDRIYDGTNPCTSITVHETDNTDQGADAQAHADLQSSIPEREVSWHITVDDTEEIRSYPDTAQCWHAGDREANETSIAIEICVNKGGDYDKAFARAAAVTADLRAKHGIRRDHVFQHNHWSGKNCPRRMRAADRWEEFLNLTDNKGPKMISPFEGRVTAEWHGYPGHAGIDIAPPKPGQVDRPVYSAFDMYIVRLCRWSEPGNKLSTWAPYRTGNGLLGKNEGPGTSGDGEGNGYNHMMPLASLRDGDFVKAGDLIGYNDRSGNQTGPHLHLELWSDWRNPNSDYNPRLAFNKCGVVPGSAPPEPARPTDPGEKNAGAHRTYKPGEVRNIQEALDHAGYDPGPADDDYGHRTEAAVKDYQRQQQYPTGRQALVADGDWGPGTAAHYEWTRRLQNTLNKWVAVEPKIRIDGDLCTATTRAIGQAQDGSDRDGKPQAAYRKAGGRTVDSEPGPVTCKMLELPTHP